MNRSMFLLMLFSATALVTMAGCSTLPGTIEENLSPPPKLKYEASWWSERDDKSVRDQIIERRKTLIDRRKREIAALDRHAVADSPRGGHTKSRGSTAPARDEARAAEIPWSQPNGLPRREELSRTPPVEPETPPVEPETPPGEPKTRPVDPVTPSVSEEVRLVQHHEPVSSQRREPEANLRVLTDDPLTQAVQLRGIIGDASGGALALLEISNERTVHVRMGDVLDIVSGNRLLQVRVQRISGDAVYLQPDQNINELVIVR